MPLPVYLVRTHSSETCVYRALRLSHLLTSMVIPLDRLKVALACKIWYMVLNYQSDFYKNTPRVADVHKKKTFMCITSMYSRASVFVFCGCRRVMPRPTQQHHNKQVISTGVHLTCRSLAVHRSSVSSIVACVFCLLQRPARAAGLLLLPHVRKPPRHIHQLQGFGE